MCNMKMNNQMVVYLISTRWGDQIPGSIPATMSARPREQGGRQRVMLNIIISHVEATPSGVLLSTASVGPVQSEPVHYSAKS